MNKLFSLLKSLSKREWSALEQYLDNAAINKQEDVRLLFRLWKQSKAEVDKEAGFRSIYPDLKFNVDRWHLKNFAGHILEADQYLLHHHCRHHCLLVCWSNT